MKYLLTIAIAAVSGLALPPSGMAQDVLIQTGQQGLRIANPNQFSNYGSDSYGRRLNRYQNNYGYRNNGYRNGGYNGGAHNDDPYNDGHHNDGFYNDGYRDDGYSHSGQYGYRNHDYYGGNYGRVRDYRDHYRSNGYRGYHNGYNNGYYYRPGFSIGGGSSRVFFGF